MKHNEWQVLVSAYHDGELPMAQHAQVESHLAGCTACRQALAAYQQMGQAVHALPRGEPSREVWLRVREGLPGQRSRAPWWRILVATPAAALLVIALTLFAVLGLNLGRPALAPTFQEAKSAEADLFAAGTPTRAEEAADAQRGLAAPTATYGVAAAPPAPCAEPTCPGAPLALEMVSLSVRSTGLSHPRLQGRVYDDDGRPQPHITLVISGTAGWQGSATTAADGTFSLDLPRAGVYRLVLALGPQEDSLLGQVAEEKQWSEVSLPDGVRCRAPLLLETAALQLGSNEEAVLILRVRY